MKLTPFLAVSGFLLLVALSVLIQLAVAKWRQEKRLAERKRADAEAKRGRPS